MSDRQESFALLLEQHFYDTGWRCSCGWTGSADDWIEQHFSAILDAESASWTSGIA